MNISSVYCGSAGALILDVEHGAPEAVLAFGRMFVPDDTRRRAARLYPADRNEQYEYMLNWCDFKMQREYEAKQ